MIPATTDSFLEYYTGIRKRTHRLLAVIPPGKIHFAYRPGKFTIQGQIRHIAAIERYVFAEIVAGRPTAYPGVELEDTSDDEHVISYFNRLHEESLKIFRALRDVDLQKVCRTPAGHQVKIGDWLMLLPEHEIHHRAQLYIYLNMLDIMTPPMFGMSAEDLETR